MFLPVHNSFQFEVSARTVIPIEFKISKSPSLGMGANITRLRKLFSDKFNGPSKDIDILKGLIVTMSNLTIPLASELTAITFDEYLKEVSNLTGD